MREWRVHLAADTLRVLSEPAFVAGARTTAARLISDQLRQVALLRGRVFP